jgi:hypothetical protein
MTHELTNELPPYQSIDVAVGRNKGVTKQPIAGWVLLDPVEYFLSEPKNPEGRQCFRAWIHFQEGCEDGVSNRKHWTLR